MKRTDTWKDFEEADPLYALLGQVSTYKVLNPDGVLDTERLTKYVATAMVQKAAKKPKDWVEIWAAMDIPVTQQTVVLEPLVSFAMTHSPDTLGTMLAELLRGHRVKTKTVEEAFQGAYKGGVDNT